VRTDLVDPATEAGKRPRGDRANANFRPAMFFRVRRGDLDHVRFPEARGHANLAIQEGTDCGPFIDGLPIPGIAVLAMRTIVRDRVRIRRAERSRKANLVRCRRIG
jgi:hypothetical protein